MPRPAQLLMCLLGPAVLGCGTSFEALHESEVRFEHCYRLDLEPLAAPTHRLFCWQEWRETYSAEQPLDRIEYAERRIRGLQGGDISRPSLQISAAAAPSAAAGDEELPRSSTVAPPATAATAASAEAPPEDAARACTNACFDGLTTCRSLCEGRCERCVEEYRGCTQRCVDEPKPSEPSK